MTLHTEATEYDQRAKALRDAVGVLHSCSSPTPSVTYGPISTPRGSRVEVFDLLEVARFLLDEDAPPMLTGSLPGVVEVTA